MNIVPVVAAVIRQEGKFLICDRPQGKPPYGWEFPGGKVESGESMAQALVRELQEELALTVMTFDTIYVERITLTDKIIELNFIRCRLDKTAKIICREGQNYRWVAPRELVDAGLLEPDRGFAEFLAMANNILSDYA